MTISKISETYGGFTIGPIFEVLSSAKKTRELWFGSYFFSWYMEKLIEELCKDTEIQFLVPYVKKPFQPSSSRAGLFPDRLVIKSSKMDPDTIFTKIKTADEQALLFFSKIANDILVEKGTNANIDINRIIKILGDYIQRRFVVLPISSGQSEQESVQKILKYLDTLEERRIFPLGKMDDVCQHCRRLPSIVLMEIPDKKQKHQHICPLCILKLFAHQCDFLKNRLRMIKKTYPSTGEIALADIWNKIPREERIKYLDIDDEIVYSKLKSKKLKPFHKYMAILEIDGDNMGNQAKKAKSSEKFSSALSAFAEKAKEKIEEYQGEPVYIGGDDILAFAPTAIYENSKMKTVLDLVKELKTLFTETLQTDTANCPPEDFTFSAGVSIAFYKYPLATSLEYARYLQSRAKRKGKNRLFIRSIKHSGTFQELGFSFSANDKLDKLSIFSELLAQILSEEIQVPHTLHHKLSAALPILELLPTKERMDAFFAQGFQAKEKKLESGISRVKDIISLVLSKGDLHQGFTSKSKERRAEIKEVIEWLWFIKFLRGDKE